MKFDFCIGNPPYQADIENEGDRANPVYYKFMDAAYEIADCVELIHPARFLFNAGQTPKAWNNKMLNDKHFKILNYEPDANKIFANTDIKGGIAISLHHQKKTFEIIGVFTKYSKLTDIVRKVSSCVDKTSRLDSIIASQGLFRFSSLFFDENPIALNVIGKGTGNKIVSSVMEKLPEVFTDTQINNDDVHFLGRVKNQRSYKYIKRSYLENNEYIDRFKLFIPEANNTGKFGETLTEPIIGQPGDGSSDTYLSAGQFDTVEEAKNLIVYLKTKFFRALLGVKKVTQHSPAHVWQMIPLQDFTPNSDIDWSQSIVDIDKQLYKKYGLSQEEIDFIETKVKAME